MHITSENVIVGDEIEFGIDGTLGELQKFMLESLGDKVLQVDAETGEQLTAKDALARSVQLAKKLQAMGVGKGDTVTVNSENRVEYVIVPFACFFIGASFAPLNPEYTEGELIHVLNLSKPKIIFCSKSTYKLMSNMMKQFAFMKQLILFDHVKDPKVLFYKELIKGASIEAAEQYSPEEFDPADTVATILCSSGTTGLPKGVMTTHRNMTTFAEVARARVQELFNFQEDNEETSLEVITLGLIPFFHSMGFMTMYMNTLRGSTIVVIKQFRAQLFLESIEKYKVNTLIVPPPVLLLLLKHPLAKKYDLSSLLDVRSGAASMGKDMEMELMAKFKLRHISQSYGMTETTLGVMVSSFTGNKPGSVGAIVPGMMVKVVDEQGKALGPNQEGEICLKGPLIMKGYVNDPVATANTIDSEGWLHTGDVAYFDNDLYFYIVDRIKELIKYKAFQVAPAELEALLLQHPQVDDAGVVGLPDSEAGELPLAFVVRKEGKKVTEKELLDYVAANVSRQKCLRGGVQFVEAIPKNPSGKILRRVLKQKAIALKAKL